MNAGEVDRGDIVVRTDQDWGDGVVLLVSHDEARISWDTGSVVSWVPLKDLAFSTWTQEEIDGIQRRAVEMKRAIDPLID